MSLSDVIPAPPELTDPRAQASYGLTLPVLRRLREAGHEAVLVGGGIRDLLLARPVSDWDIATSAPPSEVLSLWPEAIPTGLKHGTVTLNAADGGLEITTYRVEGPYSDGRHPDWVRFGTSLREDLARRDFTINAMALDPMGKELIDPEKGRLDLERRLLRTVGDPGLRFEEDGLRPLRGIRLVAALDLSVHPMTVAAMSRAQSTVAAVARERIRVELLKLMEAPRPSRGIELMRRTALLEVVLPELLESVAVAQNRYHAYDVYEHTLRALDAAPRDKPLVRLAALLHDVGKPRTREEIDGQGTFYRHERVGATMTRRILGRLRFSREDSNRVTGLVEQHMFHYTPDWSEGAVRRFLRRVGVENVEDLFDLRRADDVAHGTGIDSTAALDDLRGRIQSVRARQEALKVEDLAVDGRDVMDVLGLAPGPEVGAVLDRLLDRVLEDPSLNTRETLLELAEQLRSA